MLGLKKKNKNQELKTFFNEQWKEEKLIGEGSYGKVYKAKKEEFGIATYSAIKQIEIPQSASEIQTLKTEGMTQAELPKYFERSVQKWVEEIKFMSIFKDSQNIVNIEDYEVVKKKNEIGWIINIRMELLENLDSHILEKNVTDKEILKMAIDIATALEDCEQNHIVHRDIKPDNIFVNKKGIYKLGDFGVAKNMDKSLSNMSKKGTENYMAPEIYKNGKGNKTVDIYSLGIMLYRYFNYNRLPFLPDYPEEITIDAREEALYKRITGERLKPPQNAPREIAEIILKACSYYPKDRYENATELKKDLQEVFNEINKPTVLFDFNAKQMSKIYKENSKSDSHNSTKSVLTGKIENEVVDENLKEINEKVENENDNDNKIEDEDKPENREDKETKQENDTKANIKSEEKIEEKIKSKFSVKIKEHKKKLIFLAILIIIILATFLVIMLMPKKEEGKQLVQMPSVVGMQSETAVEELNKIELQIEYEYIETQDEEQIGKVLEQSINAEEQVEKGTTVKLKIAVSEQKIVIINVVGKTLDEAKTELQNIGLNIEVTEQYSEDVEQGKIISQMPQEGEEVYKNSIVQLLVSLGKEEKDEENKEQETKNTVQQQTQSKPTQQQTTQSQPTQQQTQTQKPVEPQEVKPTSIQLSNTTSFLLSGKSIKVTATVLPSNATNKTVVWSSSDTSVATVAQDGTVKAVGKRGMTLITATVQGTGITKSFSVTAYIKGDANGDGRIDKADADYVLERFKYKDATTEDLLRADLDGNGALDSADAAMVYNMMKY